MSKWYRCESKDWINLDRAEIIYVEKNEKFSGWQIMAEINEVVYCLGLYSTADSAQDTLDKIMGEDEDYHWIVD